MRRPRRRAAPSSSCRARSANDSSPRENVEVMSPNAFSTTATSVVACAAVSARAPTARHVVDDRVDVVGVPRRARRTCGSRSRNPSRTSASPSIRAAGSIAGVDVDYVACHKPHLSFLSREGVGFSHGQRRLRCPCERSNGHWPGLREGGLALAGGPFRLIAGHVRLAPCTSRLGHAGDHSSPHEYEVSPTSAMTV